MRPISPILPQPDSSESVTSPNLPTESEGSAFNRSKRQIILKNAVEAWPTSNPINYAFDAELGKRIGKIFGDRNAKICGISDADSEATEQIRKAFDFWSSQTCLKFEENIGDDYIFIANGPG